MKRMDLIINCLEWVEYRYILISELHLDTLTHTHTYIHTRTHTQLKKMEKSMEFRKDPCLPT